MIRVFRSLEEAAGNFGPCALSIGNFDGVHRGHQRIFAGVVRQARAHGWKASALTFDPHPARVVAPARAPRLLSSHEERCAWMEACGIEQTLILPFDRAFSERSPENFVEDVLAARLDARAVLVGDNFRFGYRHAGDIHKLAELGLQHGIHVEAVPAVRERGVVLSSSEIRKAIEAGGVARAARMLGRPYAVTGEVVRGLGVGSRHTVPTLNLETRAEVLPAIGVYITETTTLDDQVVYPSLTNIGFRPTFFGNRLSVETFLLDTNLDRTPERIRVAFLRRLREERKFSTPAELKSQILCDAGRARAFFRRVNRWPNSVLCLPGVKKIHEV